MAVFTRVKTWVSNEVLTASDLNGEFNNLLNNTIPASIEDYSADVSTMQTTADPGGVGTESLATTLAGEIARLRYKIKQMMNGAQWYSTPVGSLSAGGIGASSIANDSIATAKMQTDSINTVNITNGAVTRAKQAAVGQQLSASSGLYQMTSSTHADVTNLSVSITTTGRPVKVELVQDGSASTGYMLIEASGGSISAVSMALKVLRGATEVNFQTWDVGFPSASASNYAHAPISIGNTTDIVAAGTYTYKVTVATVSATSRVTVNNLKLLAYEL